MFPLRRAGAFFITLLLLSVGTRSQTKPENTPAAKTQQVLFLSNANNDQQVAAAIGQRIEISLSAVGPDSYVDPVVSARTIRFENVASPRLQTPGGPTQIYIFQAMAEGNAEIRIPRSHDSFSVTVQVLANGNPGPAKMTPDQTNAAKWDGAWTNLINDVRQTFKPAMPKLEAVEVNLSPANDGPDEEEVTLYVLDAAGDILTTLSRNVSVSECAHARFVFSEGGLPVTPGDVYSIHLSGKYRFGWKYVVGGYENGEASFNGKPLLPRARSTFLFTTFGAS